MANYTFGALKVDYAELWRTMQVDPIKQEKIDHVATTIIELKDKYKPLEDATGVPWYFIGLLHLRESNNNFNTHLHNGDPLSARTRHIPAGYPKVGSPPFTFEYSAIDALRYMKLDQVTYWGIEQIAYYFEQYNGFGYRKKRVNSPYLWAGTNHYRKGKYIRDGVYNANVVDQQLGVMPILKAILDRENIAVVALPLEGPTPLSPAADLERPTSKELRQKSRKFRIIEWFKWFFGLTTGGATAAKTLDATNIMATKSYVDSLKLFITEYGIFIFIVACSIAFFATVMLIKYMKDDVEEGRATPSGENK